MGLPQGLEPLALVEKAGGCLLQILGGKLDGLSDVLVAKAFLQVPFVGFWLLAVLKGAV